ncbi:hypothetical protein J6590_027944 [Homalodisca vitripennis]|nr:hypothetical protein J6590_027944 [Homalodisca vitripennis]
MRPLTEIWARNRGRAPSPVRSRVVVSKACCHLGNYNFSAHNADSDRVTARPERVEELKRVEKHEHLMRERWCGPIGRFEVHTATNKVRWLVRVSEGMLPLLRTSLDSISLIKTIYTDVSGSDHCTGKCCVLDALGGYSTLGRPPPISGAYKAQDHARKSAKDCFGIVAR